MKRLTIILMVFTTCSFAWAQSYYHDYKSFFSKEDRVGLFSDKAKARYSESIRQSIADNTLLIDCGSKGKPATGFIACLLYTSPSPRDQRGARMPSSA